MKNYESDELIADENDNIAENEEDPPLLEVLIEDENLQTGDEGSPKVDKMMDGENAKKIADTAYKLHLVFAPPPSIVT